jgi:hypothetical protein
MVLIVVIKRGPNEAESSPCSSTNYSIRKKGRNTREVCLLVGCVCVCVCPLSDQVFLAYYLIYHLL